MWECGTWRGAVLAECCCVATAMGEWGQAGDDSWKGVGEEAEAREGERRERDGCVIGATHAPGPLRSVTIVFIRSHTPATPTLQHFLQYVQNDSL